MKSPFVSRVPRAPRAAANAVAIRNKRAALAGPHELAPAVRDLADLLAQIAAAGISRRLAERGARRDMKKRVETP
jgi:hypothetical protein